MEVVLSVSIGSLILGGCYYLFRPTIHCTNRVLHGLPRASLVYTDEKGGKLLVAHSLDLQGKPDFIFEKWFTKKLIPLEIKSGKCREDTPHIGDLMQLVAYFLIIEDVYGQKPPYGKLVYSNKTFTIRNTYALRQEAKEQLKLMRKMLRGNYYPPADPSYIKCKNCVCQHTVCEWAEED